MYHHFQSKFIANRFWKIYTDEIMIIPIVNENDEIIGQKRRSDIDHGYDIFRSASLWITNSKGEVLLAQRKFTKKIDPGKWSEAVGGTVEGDDSYETTIAREAEEELGLKNIQIQIGPKILFERPCRAFAQFYTATIDKEIDGFQIQKEEIEQIAWVPREQLFEDVLKNPDKYIGAMQEIIKLF